MDSKIPRTSLYKRSNYLFGFIWIGRERERERERERIYIKYRFFHIFQKLSIFNKKNKRSENNVAKKNLKKFWKIFLDILNKYLNCRFNIDNNLVKDIFFFKEAEILTTCLVIVSM